MLGSVQIEKQNAPVVAIVANTYIEVDNVEQVLSLSEVQGFMNGLMSRLSIGDVAVKGSEVKFALGGLIFTLILEKKKIDGHGEEFFNATEFVKQYNKQTGKKKRLVRWTESVRFKEIVEIWETEKRTPKNKIYRKERVGKTDNIKVHKDLFYSLCIWLDAKYEVAIADFLNKVGDGVSVAVLEREKESQADKSLNASLKLLDDMLQGEDSRFRALSTVNNWVNEKASKGSVTSGRVDHDTWRGSRTHSRGEVALNVDALIFDGILDGKSGRYISDDVREFFGRDRKGHC